MGKKNKRPNGDGNIRQRSKNSWEGRLTVGMTADRQPIVKYVYGSKQREVVEKLNKLKALYDGVTVTEDSNMLLSAWLKKWIDEHKAPMLRETTTRKYRSMAEKHINPYLGNIKLSKLKTSEIQEMYNTLKEYGRQNKSETMGTALSNTMVRGIHMMLHEALDSAVNDGLIPVNPTEGATIPKIEKRQYVVLTEEQIGMFIKELEKEPLWYDFFCLELMTGMRRGEICGLQWTDFNEETGILHIQRSIQYIDRKLRIGETKTNEGNRKIVLPQRAQQLLVERAKHSCSKWIFPHHIHADKPIHPQKAYMTLKIILQRAELPDMRLHDLRHTFATLAASSGVDPRTLASILGHTKPSFTLDAYTHVTTDMQRRAAVVVHDYITDVFGEELSPWERDEKEAMEL